MTVKTTAALLGAVLVASTAGAQARPQAAAAGNAAPKCDIQSGGSPQISAAYDALSKFNATSDPAEQPKLLSASIKELSSMPEDSKDQVARSWVLGQTLVAWTLVDDTPTIGPRASYGYTTNPDGTIDILLAADSAFKTVVQASQPCATQIDPMHRMAVVAATNEATSAFNAGDMDQAKALSQRILSLEPESAHAYHLLANVDVKQQNYAAAVDNFEKVIARSANDSTLKDVHENAIISSAYLLQNLADADPGDGSKALAEKAAKYFRDYVALHPEDSDAQAALSRTLVTAGDTLAANDMYASMIADPSKYAAMDLLNAGVGAANAGKNTQAVALLEAGVKSNPYLRDGLFVLSQVALQAGELDKANDAAARLVAVDPNNPDNYHLRAAIYQEMLGLTTDKNIQKSVTDSMIRVNQAAGRITVKLTVTDFAQPSTTQRILNGTVENLAEAPADYTINFEFLDTNGAVVASKSETITQVAGSSSKAFSVSVDGTGIAAYRYAPISVAAGAGGE